MAELLTRDFWVAFWHEEMKSAPGVALRVATIFILYWLARRMLLRVGDIALARLVARQAHGGADDRANRVRTLQTLARSVVSYTLFFVFLVTTLHTLSVDITGILTTAGVGGVAIGFGAQKVIRDVLAGFFIIMEDQFSVGEYVTITNGALLHVGPAMGTVIDVSMRVTRLRDDQGREWTLSNGDIVTVINHSRAPVRSTVNVALPVGGSVEKFRTSFEGIAGRIGDESGGLLHEPPRILGVTSMDGASPIVAISVVSEPRRLEEARMLVRENALVAMGSEPAPAPRSA